MNQYIQQSLSYLFEEYPQLQSIINKINAAGGKALLVGGAVRDIFLGKMSKDIDIEIYGIPGESLAELLKEFGPVSYIGKAFGVYRIHGLDIDWSLPRSDEPGRKPAVTIDPHMQYKEAFARRDLTINAMGIDLTTGELIDPFNGLQDVQQGILRAPSAQRFVEDPLRLFRVMQFCGRFEMEPDEELNRICSTMNIKGVSRERIEEELEKLLLLSSQPSRGFRWLDQIGRLGEIFPELAALKGILQDPIHHPEGDVFEHTMQTIDAAACLRYDDPRKSLVLLYAALCHDLGKKDTTEKIEGRLRSLGHELLSRDLAQTMLSRITHNEELIDGVKKLVRYHLEPFQFIDNNAQSSAYKRLARKLAPHVTIEMLARLACADKQARNPKGKPFEHEISEVNQFLAHAKNSKVETKPEMPVLYGRDLIDVIEPGPKMGSLLKKAYELQLEEGIQDKEELKKRILNMINHSKSS